MNLSGVVKKWLPDSFVHSSADLLREKYFSGRELPVDVELLADLMGIHLVPLADLRRETGADGCISMSAEEIYVDQNLMSDPKLEFRLRFTVAHELGHLVLHEGLIRYLREQADGSLDRWIELQIEYERESLARRFESQAHEFAGRLLVPIQSLELAMVPMVQKLRENHVEASVVGIAQIAAYVAPLLHRRFGVSEKTMQIRIEKERSMRAMLGL